MPQEDRFAIFHELMNFAWQSLLELPEEERRRRLEWLERQHEEASSRLEEKFRTLP